MKKQPASALGTGITPAPLASSPSVASLLEVGSDLYVGGSFGAAGGKASFNLGHWSETRNFDLRPAIHLGNVLKLPSGPFKFGIMAT